MPCSDRFPARAAPFRPGGQIVGEWVGLLEAECRELIGSNVSGREILLDLGDVSFVDRPAVRVLRQLIRESVGIMHRPPHVEELLIEVTNWRLP
jgi:hypothetical protein